MKYYPDITETIMGSIDMTLQFESYHACKASANIEFDKIGQLPFHLLETTMR